MTQNAGPGIAALGAAALLALLPLRAPAQEEAANAAFEPRRYTVELIVFRYRQDVSVGSEVFLPELVPEVPVTAAGDGEFVFGDRPGPVAPGPATEATADAAAQERGEFDFVLLVPEEYSLTDTYRRLQRLDVYEPLLHVAWTQTTLPEEQTQSIDLLALAEPPPGLDGSFKLYLSRYLHLVVDLSLDAAPETPVEVDDSMFSYRNNRRDAESAGGGTGRLRYHIAEDRIFKSGDLRYFDHPKFGVLAKVTRVEAAVDDGVEQEMLGYDPADLPGNGSQ